MKEHESNTRSAIVTGGASGIGRALAEELAGAGIQVVLADRQVELAGEVAAGIREGGGTATVADLDVRDFDRFRELVQHTVSNFGRLDYLFNNAGIVVIGEARDFDLADWDEVIDVNLKGVTNGILAAYPLMMKQGFGHIVNTASMAGLVPLPMMGNSYVASKHAVVGLSRALRIEAARYGVNISVICPGAVRTPAMEGKGRYGRLKLDPAVWDEIVRSAGPVIMDPPLFARRVIRAVNRNRSVIIEPKLWILLWYLYRISPWLSMTLTKIMVSGMDARINRN